ncbi:uncharacterized protein JN550_002141 [Neoarthrinium moseri]|uniref:uncharacterized protein n=1 Tax=Neoarthrinium moseri TaxID=1658444 RepID=UPI001FDE27C8|nr:uncharacterized protein JN550_002141 [Neoarthrinium moseri]KAI1875855.1 hypothetical protein JN550_002141 [Neoarthrinium moseri]
MSFNDIIPHSANADLLVELQTDLLRQPKEQSRNSVSVTNAPPLNPSTKISVPNGPTPYTPTIHPTEDARSTTNNPSHGAEATLVHDVETPPQNLWRGNLVAHPSLWAVWVSPIVLHNSPTALDLANNNQNSIRPLDISTTTTINPGYQACSIRYQPIAPQNWLATSYLMRPWYGIEHPANLDREVASQKAELTYEILRFHLPKLRAMENVGEAKTSAFCAWAAGRAVRPDHVPRRWLQVEIRRILDREWQSRWFCQITGKALVFVNDLTGYRPKNQAREFTSWMKGRRMQIQQVRDEEQARKRQEVQASQQASVKD